MIRNKRKPDSEEKVMSMLHPHVREWVKKKFGSLIESQLFSLKEIHSRNNILLSAPTGCGKTLASSLSIINELVDSAEKGILEDKVYAVYINPLKALSRDIDVNLNGPLKEINEIAGKDLGIRIQARTGDTSAKDKSKMLKTPPHILVLTPESLAILLASPKFVNHLKDVQWVIVDEIHALVENKRGTYLSLTLERLQKYSQGMCRVGLSATVSPLDEVAKFLVGPKRNCKICDVSFVKKLDLKVVSPVDDLVNTTYEEVSKKTYELIDKYIQEHKTTLIFTNTRSATEKMVHHLKEKFPQNYYEVGDDKKKAALIGAHHSSLSAEHRLEMEQGLRDGKLRCIVCSTSLELGIDIGSIDLVLCIGSPKSVARALQRVGRAGHSFKEVSKGRFIVTDRDDLVECSVLLKQAIEKKIDTLHIPTNALDVLAQQLFGMAIERVWDYEDLFETVKMSYCYKDLKVSEFNEVLDYLAGEFTTLEDRHVYARIWWDKEESRIGKRGKLARVLYMTNIGTIPDSQGVFVKERDRKVGVIEEGFLEKLKKGDVFVLGGNTYRFNYARGMVAQVTSVPGKRPTVPAWYSQRLPLSFDLGAEIVRFKGLIAEKFKKKLSKKQILKFIDTHLYVDGVASEAIYNYCKDQYDYIGMSSPRKMLIEHYKDMDGKKYVIFHSNYGRRVNDALSRAIGFSLSRPIPRDVEVGISDNGFYVSYSKKVDPLKAFAFLKEENFRQVLENALDSSEVFKRRFRHCAGRSLMILRNYMGRRKRVGRQQVSSMILMAAVRRISNKFFLLQETKREVLEDLMDVGNALRILKGVENKNIKVVEVDTLIPSPFALNLVLQGYSDILRMEDRQEFLKRMHMMVKAKIAIQNR
jgi:ATP-dependent helicase Lhr and Lhr-like helicase